MNHIIEAISDTNIGGAGRLLLARLACRDPRLFRYTVVIPKGSMLKQPLLELNVSVLEVPFGFDRSFELKAVLGLTRILRDRRPQLVHAHGWFSMRLAAFLAKVPVSIYTRHCVYDLTRGERLAVSRFFQRMVCGALSDQVIAVSPAARDNLLDLGIGENKIKVIVNGCRPASKITEKEKDLLKHTLGIPKDAVVVGILARLERCKDHACFLRAAKRLIRESKGKCYRFLIVGGGSLLDNLKEQSKTLKIDDKVFFTGFLSDPSPILNLFDINVNCSVGTETSSLALSEGMSLGIPAVASNFGGNPYMVRNGENGFLYNRGDDKMLAEQIRRIAENPSLAQKMSKKAEERFECELNAMVMTKQYEALYRSWITKNRNR